MAVAALYVGKFLFSVFALVETILCAILITLSSAKIYQVATFDYFSVTHETFSDLFGPKAHIPPFLPHRKRFVLTTKDFQNGSSFNYYAINETESEENSNAAEFEPDGRDYYFYYLVNRSMQHKKVQVLVFGYFAIVTLFATLLFTGYTLKIVIKEGKNFVSSLNWIITKSFFMGLFCLFYYESSMDSNMYANELSVDIENFSAYCIIVYSMMVVPLKVIGCFYNYYALSDVPLVLEGEVPPELIRRSKEVMQKKFQKKQGKGESV